MGGEAKTAVLIIDVINDFLSGVLGSERASAIVPKIRDLLDRARKSGLPLIYITDSVPCYEKEIAAKSPYNSIAFLHQNFNHLSLSLWESFLKS